MKHTHGLSLGEARRSRKAALVGLILTIMALAAPASAAQGQDVDAPGGGQHAVTALGRSWS